MSRVVEFGADEVPCISSFQKQSEELLVGMVRQVCVRHRGLVTRLTNAQLEVEAAARERDSVYSMLCRIEGNLCEVKSILEEDIKP